MEKEEKARTAAEKTTPEIEKTTNIREILKSQRPYVGWGGPELRTCVFGEMWWHGEVRQMSLGDLPDDHRFVATHTLTRSGRTILLMHVVYSTDSDWHDYFYTEREWLLDGDLPSRIRSENGTLYGVKPGDQFAKIPGEIIKKLANEAGLRK